jgi:hypothetical protein
MRTVWPGQCQRLIILGGPGSGKTWLAKRTVRRCAEEGLESLARGMSLDEVELPLYTTCSRLFSVDGHIRQATVSSALSQLSDLGSSRITEALRVLFTERNGPTVLVADTLDEARGGDERLRQVDTLPWRVILTSRPISWNQQLAFKEGDSSHRVGELQSGLGGGVPVPAAWLRCSRWTVSRHRASWRATRPRVPMSRDPAFSRSRTRRCNVGGSARPGIAGTLRSRRIT